MFAVTYQSTQSAASGTVTKPTSTVESDLLIAYVIASGTAVTFTAPANVSTLESYSETNQDSTTAFSATITGLGQALTVPAAATLDSVKFYISKTASPTGNAVAKVYASTGTVGSTAIPTGAALATSDNFDVATLSTSLALITFNFTAGNRISLSASTDYVVTVEYAGSDVTNKINVGIDGSSPTHAGNRTRLTSGVWAAPGFDTIFYLYGILASDTSAWNPLTIVHNTNTSGVSAQAFWKICGTNESSSYAFTSSGTINSASISRFTGHDLTTPINASLGTADTTTSKTITLAGVTPSVANCMLLMFTTFLATGGTTSGYAVVTSNPSPWTEIVDRVDSNMTLAAAVSSIRSQTTATGNATALVTTADSADNRKAGYLIAIAPGADVTISADLVSMTAVVGDPDYYMEPVDISIGLLSPADNDWSFVNKPHTDWTFTNKP